MPLWVGLLGIMTACFDAEAKWHLLPAQACLAACSFLHISVGSLCLWPSTFVLVCLGTFLFLKQPKTGASLFLRMDPFATEFTLQAKLLQTPKQGQNPRPQKALLTPIPLMPAFQWPLPQKLVLCLQHRLLQQLQRQTLPVSPRWQICQNMANLMLTTLLLHPLRSGSWHVCNTSAGDIQNVCNTEMNLTA